MYVSFEFKRFFFEGGDLIVECILLLGIVVLHFSKFFSIQSTQFAEFFKEMSNLSIFKIQLGLKNFNLSIFVLDGSVKIIEFGSGIGLNLFH